MVSPEVTLVGTLAPLLLYSVLRKFVIDQYSIDEEEEQRPEETNRNRDTVAKSKADADTTKALMMVPFMN